MHRITKWLTATGGVAMATTLNAKITGLWNFDSGNLNGTIGAALEYRDGVGGATQTGTAFNTTTALGIPNIGGVEAKVMKFPGGGPDDTGYLAPTPADANGGSTLVNNYTLLFDVLYPAASNSKLRALVETDRNVDADSEFFVLANNKVGGKAANFGALTPDAWHRVGIVSEIINEEAGTVRFRFYIDGVEAGAVTAGNVRDLKFALSAGGVMELFSDDNNETATGYVNSIQVHDTALSKGQMLALGGPAAAGLPSVLPPVPSYLEKWFPGGAFASRTAKLGAVINTGDTTIQDSSISLTLDGAPLASPTITRDGGLITVEKTPAAPLSLSKHELVLTLTDSLAGQKKLTNQFTSVLFFEDFESIALGPRIEETTAGTEPFTEGWTNSPPTGWTIDNSLFPATIIGPDNPDDDGDGRADLDGRSEWAGWSFATKDFWVASDNQTRDQFFLGEGTLAIADPDEWDDSSHLQSFFNSFLKTPEISLDGVPANTAFLSFASSWRPEGFDDAGANFPTGPNGEKINNQTAIITVSFDGGAPVQILKYDSDDRPPPIGPGPNYKPDAQSEAVLLQLNNPAGAKKMVLSFEMRDGANDWWWAIDNVAIGAGATPPAFTKQPAGLEVNEGQPASIEVTVAGEGLSYQWYKGSGASRSAVTGATAAKLEFAATKVSDGGVYSVDVKNTVGTTTSNPALLTVLPSQTGRLVLLKEDFNSLTLGPAVDETVEGDANWTKTAPDGWTIDDTGVPGAGTDNDGVTEWAGWSFATVDFWNKAGGQNRDQFKKGTGAVAIADSDEWDDKGHDAGNMATYLKTKTVSLDGVKANSLVLQYDSSWNPEEPQKANLVVSFDGGPATEIYRYESANSSPSYHPAALNETLVIPISNPAGAKNLTLTWGYFETLNNWWFAIDNILLLGDPAPVFFEDFEGLALGPNVEEGITTGSGGAQTAVWTKSPPAGWSIDDTGVPGAGTDQDGVTEWAGWSFAKREWWAATAGDQDRTKFTKGVGTVAIADSDEWDDIKPHAAGNMATFLKTRAIDITGKTANALYLKFDSSWRDEDPQKAVVRVSYDGAAPVEVLRFESVDGTYFHNDNPNETVTIPLYNPDGAKSMVITFGYFDTLNNWWWAIDNLEVNVGAVAPPPGPVVNPDPQIPGLTGGAFTDVQVDTATKTISAKLPAGGGNGFLSIKPALNILSVQITGDRIVIKYQ